MWLYLKQHRKGLVRWAAAFSLASLWFIRSETELLYEAHAGFYHRLPANNTMLLALLANLALFTTFFWLLNRAFSLVRSRLLRRLGGLLLCAALLVPLDFFYPHVRPLFQQAVGAQALVKWFLGLAPLALLGLALVYPRAAAKLAVAILLILVPYGLLSSAKLAIGLTQTRPPYGPDPVPAGSRALAERPQARFVWILFDGLDEHLLLSARPEGLRLPAFDRFRGESITATHALMAGVSTDTAIPGLTTGRFVVKSEPINAGDMNLFFEDDPEPASWRAQPNVFKDVTAQGGRVAVIGWHLPYDRLFGNTTAFVYSLSSPFSDCVRATTFFGSMACQISAIGGRFYVRREHWRRWDSGIHKFIWAASSPDFDLVFWHAPIPHLPGIYDPESHRFTVFRPLSDYRSYLGNLAAADLSLRLIREQMEKAGQWDRSWVLVTSDHAAKGRTSFMGPTDYQVPFLLKPPSRNGPVAGASRIYARPLNTAVSRDLILAILRGEIREADDATRWLEKQSMAVPTHYPRNAISD